MEITIQEKNKVPALQESGASFAIVRPHESMTREIENLLPRFLDAAASIFEYPEIRQAGSLAVHVCRDNGLLWLSSAIGVPKSRQVGITQRKLACYAAQKMAEDAGLHLVPRNDARIALDGESSGGAVIRVGPIGEKATMIVGLSGLLLGFLHDMLVLLAAERCFASSPDIVPYSERAAMEMCQLKVYRQLREAIGHS